MTQTEFMQKCRAARDNDPKAKHYIDILLSSVEYETFVKLMRIMRPVAESRLASAADAKAGGSSSGNGRGGQDIRDDSAADAKGGSQSSSPVAPSKASKGGDDDDTDDGFGDGGVARSAAGSKGGYADDDDSPDAKVSRMSGADSKDAIGSK